MKKKNTSETSIDSTKLTIPAHIYDKLKSIIDKKISDKVLFEFLVVSRSPNHSNNLRYKFYKNNKYKIQSNYGEEPRKENKNIFFYTKYGDKKDTLIQEETENIEAALENTFKKYPESYYSKEAKGGSFYILKSAEKVIVFEALSPELYDIIYNLVGQ